MRAILLSTDLMVVSHVRGAAARTGATLDTASNADDAAAICQREQADLLLVDLATPVSALSVFVNRLKGDAAAAPTIVAFGPHVHAERLEAARQAGCDTVISRGQFFAGIDGLLRSGG